jgi:hypothetical protein
MELIVMGIIKKALIIKRLSRLTVARAEPVPL